MVSCHFLVGEGKGAMVVGLWVVWDFGGGWVGGYGLMRTCC